ncbi:peptidase U32 family protein [Paenibacillus macerans]|uniref:Peptidase U32 family protein n=1 Tax=Paenibacillus macerans TaxID=44252 RepID=A0A090Z5N8_PAEMA|nr:U32 family peptidase [Paenibacillus macerans]KFN05668.1 peptidase U32 family protein [Paenibacillus macerans]MCY7559880.1 U32 family peptidase [Paenibacillus macerans]MEC0151480.1 U32 family peptidase [Paenibacillus macerans]MEC0329369.1 U32 family peptidase [Paenibacillus macerans]SUA85491.1 protease [Paenibacillus macerans]
MKVKAPVISFDSAKKMLEAGAGEIYLGASNGAFKNIAYSARGNSNVHNSRITIDETELKKTVDLAHRHNASVSFLTNLPQFSLPSEERSRIEQNFIEYIQTGIQCGIDNVVVADIGQYLLIREHNIDIPCFASVYLATINAEQVKFFKELGFRRVTLEYQMLTQEIREICQVEGIDIEVFANFGGTFLNGRCSLYHNMGEELDFGFPCKSKYDVITEDILEKDYPYYDSNLYCSLCSVGKLYEMGVTTLKITGREIPSKVTEDIVRTYSKCIQYLEDNMDYMTARNLAFDECKDFWNKWCSKKRCKYIKNRVTSSYV